jgi:hypothetical protein
LQEKYSPEAAAAVQTQGSDQLVDQALVGVVEFKIQPLA